MKKTLIFLCIAMILTSSFISAEIIINQQPEPLYNVGDIIKTSFKVISSADFDPNTFFLVDILCNGIETKIMQTPIGDMKAGDEREFSPPIPLLSSIIGKTTGNCKIKAILESIDEEEYEYSLTDEFEISDLITIELKMEKTEFSPKEDIIIEGDAKKENGKAVNGIVELKVTKENESLVEKIDTIKNGYFDLNFSFPKESKAGEYFLKVDVYEVDSNTQKTNKGSTDYKILIKQIPTNLEIIFEDPEVEPGTNLKVKVVLHDQTGEKIESSANLTIKSKENILKQRETSTNDFLEFPVKYNEPPVNWTIIAVSNELTSEATCKIKEKEDVKVELINKTLTITNIGNVLYNKSVSVKIGEESLNVDVVLNVNESQKYILTAPDGEYQIEVITDEGNKMTGMATLTGKTIEIKEVKKGIISLVKYPLAWIFIILILGVIAFLIFKKGHKKMFFGHVPKEKKDKNKSSSPKKDLVINAKNKAELSLSIKGDKQNVDIVCLKLKNFKEIKSKKSNVKETLQKIVDSAEENKAFIYENQDCLFFILAPIKTRTFKNERNAIKIAQGIQESLKEHNKIFKQPIEFGISLNYGTIIAKKEKDVLKFMSMGTLITSAKKIASTAKEDILLSEKINSKLGANIKTTKEQKDKTTIYKIKEIKNREGNKKFIQNFIRRIEKDNKKKK